MIYIFDFLIVTQWSISFLSIYIDGLAHLKEKKVEAITLDVRDGS